MITVRAPFDAYACDAWFGGSEPEATLRMLLELDERFTILAGGMPNRPGQGPAPADAPADAPEDEGEKEEDAVSES